MCIRDRHTGAVKDTVMSDEGEKSPQQVIDALLVSAEQVQQEMDAVSYTHLS